MTLLSLALLSSPAEAASLDLLEVGGAYGTPAATNPTALWYNPAGIAVGGGTQFIVDIAPTFAGIDVNRADPGYEDPLQTFIDFGWPEKPNYGGEDHITFNGVVPYLGVTSDFTVPGLGIGLGMAVPTARGGTSDEATNANRYALRDAKISSIHFIGAAAYQIKNKVALGASVQFVDATYYADIDSATYPDIAWAISEELGGLFPASYQDAYIEDPAYAANLVMGGREGEDHGELRDTSFTFSVGTHVTPLPDERQLDIAVSYVHGVKLDTEGDLTMQFSCPEDYDSIGQLAFTDNGLCDATFQGKGNIAYDLPGRLHLGVASSPIEGLRLEAMGAYVMWSVFDDFVIHTEIDPDQVQVEDPLLAEETADTLSQDRLWARDNKNTYWLGLDGKYQVHDVLTLGARAMFDHAAVPDEVMSANNLDNDTIGLTGLAIVTPMDKLGVGVSFGHYFLAKREITNSIYDINLEQADPNSAEFYGENPNIDRYYYPSTNGTYTGSINRLGITLKGTFGGSGAVGTW